jgi:hypothetical protein
MQKGNIEYMKMRAAIQKYKGGAKTEPTAPTALEVGVIVLGL